jgi:ABC-2 type transport system permease protein
MIPSSLEQAGIVVKYELWNATKNRRLIWMLILVTIFSAIFAVVIGGAGNAIEFGKGFFASPAYLLITVVGALFGGDILASEFERKTGYMLFTNPIKRVTVVFGKFMACFVSVLISISILYLAGIIFMLATYGWVPSTVLGSFGLAALYGCAVLSLTMLFSSILDVVSAMMLSLLTMVAIMTMLQTLLIFKWGIEPWFLLSYTSGTIGAYIDPPAQRIVSTPAPGQYNYAYPDFTISVIVMLAYVFVSMILCIVATKRREMR